MSCRNCDSDQGSRIMSPGEQSDNEKGLFLSWYCELSDRTAILEELDGMVWLFLTYPGMLRPERDCPVFATRPIPETVDWSAVEERGTPPSLSKDVISAQATVVTPVAEQFKAVWAYDGESVMLMYRGEPVVMVVKGFRLGHSRALLLEGPLGTPFDDTLVTSFFFQRTKQD